MSQTITNEPPSCSQIDNGSGTAREGTFFKHSDTTKRWISGQANFVLQAHGDFYAAYSGPNSFTNADENANSRVMTLQTAYAFKPYTAIYLNVEEAGGGGLSTDV